MRAMRGANVSPIVELREARTKTRFGMKSRPEFDIVGWREYGAPEAPQLPAPTATAQSHNGIDKYVRIVAGQAVKPVTAAEELNDEVPF